MSGSQRTRSGSAGSGPIGPSEAAIVKAILRELNALPETRAVKTHGSAFAAAGEPDIHGCCHGRAFFLEVKRPGRKATDLQARRLRQWKDAGALVSQVVTSPEEAVRLVRMLCGVRSDCDGGDSAA